MPIDIKDGGRFSPFTGDNKLYPPLATETEKSTQDKIFHLISLQTPDPGTPWLYVVDSNYDVSFNGQIYVRFPVKFQGASISSDGSVDKAAVSIANVSREIMYYIEHYNGLRNMRMKIKTVYAKFMDFLYAPNLDGTVTTTTNPEANNTAYIEDEYYIDTYSANEQLVSFQLDPIIDLEIKLPRRRYMQDSCYFVYKDPDTCRYSGGLTTCAKNLDDCTNHGNEENFGGFPGISANRRLFL